MDKKLFKSTPDYTEKQTEISFSEDDSLLNQQDKKLNSKLKTKPLEILNIKHLPTIFFFLFLIVFCLMIIQYLPGFYQLVKTKQLYQIKSSINYFSEFFSKQNEFVRMITVLSQLFFVLVVISLSSLIKQRISVPELISEKGKNYLIMISSFVSCLTLIGLTFYNESTLRFSQKSMNLVDNVLFLFYLISAFAFCYFAHLVLLKIEINDIPKDTTYVTIKKFSLYLMGFSLFVYFLSLILVSFYTPIISVEKLLMSFLVICKEVFSILFILNYLTFVLSLKYDLFYVHLNLQIRPDIEYFVNPDETYKTVF